MHGRKASFSSVVKKKDEKMPSHFIGNTTQDHVKLNVDVCVLLKPFSVDMFAFMTLLASTLQLNKSIAFQVCLSSKLLTRRPGSLCILLSPSWCLSCKVRMYRFLIMYRVVFKFLRFRLRALVCL